MYQLSQWHFLYNLSRLQDNLKKELNQHLHLRASKGDAAKKYNVFQKLSYLIVIFVLFPFMVIGGVAQMPAFTAISPELIDLFGGRQSARTLHTISPLLLVLFVVVSSSLRHFYYQSVHKKLDDADEENEQMKYYYKVQHYLQ